MEKSNFDRLLERYMEDQVTEEEKTKIEAWLDSNKAKNGRHFIWTKEDEEELFKKITGRLDTVEEIVEYRPKEDKIRSIQVNRWLAIAATLLLLVAVSYVVWDLIDNRSTTQQVAAINDIDKVILNDGTIVWLHKDSKLIYFENQDKSERHAELVGEGLFEVAKDASRPFIIDCGEIKVKVLGTSFNLKTGKGTIELKVLTGKVNLSSATNKEGIDVEPNNKVIYAGKGDLEKVSMDKTEVNTLAMRTEYNMQFKNAAMDQIINKIERKFDVKFKVDNKQVNKCKITADFTDHSLESTLRMISEVLDFEYEINGSTVTVTGSGCK